MGVNKWKGDFTKNFFMAYGAVVGLNIYFQLLPLITHIKVGSDVIGIVPLIITIAGLFMVSDFVSMLSQYLHGDDAYSAGGGIMNRVTGKMKQGAKFVGKQAVGAFTMHYKAKGAEKRVRDTFKDADTGKYKVGEGADAKEFDKDAFERTASESGFIGGIKARNRIRKNEKEFRKAFDKLGEDDKKAAGYDEVEKIRDDYAKGLITSATDWLGEKFGIGKPSDFSSKKKKEYMEAGSATTDAAIKLNKGIQDAIKTLTEAWDPSKESKEQFSSRQASTLAKLLRGPNGDTIFKTLKGNKDFKDYVNDPTNGFGLKLSETSAAEMADRLLGRKGVLDAQQREGEARAAKISFDEETKTFFENAINNAATATGSTWDKAEALKALMSNHQLVYGDGVATQDKNFADSLNATLQTRNEATAERKDKLNADVESATIQARDIVKAYSSETDNTAFNETMQQYLGYLQNNLNNLKNDKAIVDMDHHLQDKFTDLINKQSELIKRIKETSDAEKQAITKAIQDAAKNKDKK